MLHGPSGVQPSPSPHLPHCTEEYLPYFQNTSQPIKYSFQNNNHEKNPYIDTMIYKIYLIYFLFESLTKVRLMRQILFYASLVRKSMTPRETRWNIPGTSVLSSGSKAPSLGLSLQVLCYIILNKEQKGYWAKRSKCRKQDCSSGEMLSY